MPGEKDFSIWVGDLTPDVDDLQLYRFFSNRYQSIKSAKGKFRYLRKYITFNCTYIDSFIQFFKNIYIVYNILQ